MTKHKKVNVGKKSKVKEEGFVIRPIHVIIITFIVGFVGSWVSYTNMSLLFHLTVAIIFVLVTLFIVLFVSRINPH